MSSKTAPTTIVVKRSGEKEYARDDEIKERLDNLCALFPKLTNVDTQKVTDHVALHMQSGVTTRALDELAARFCATSATIHPEYDQLAARIVVSDLHKSTNPSFVETTNLLDHTGALGKMDPRYVSYVNRNAAVLDQKVKEHAICDYGYDYFGLRTLIRGGYLLRSQGEVAETPQHMIMRVAVFLHASDTKSSQEEEETSLKEVLKAFDMMSERRFTHASPTLFNSGGIQSNALSCFLLGVHDSIDGIYKAIGDCGKISKFAGGIGVHINNIRGNNATIRSIGGRSSGIVPMLRVFEATALHVNQAGRRNGSFAIYISPWHPDILEFLRLKRHQGEEQERAQTLHYGLWVSDLFMRAVKNNADWHLFCPDQCPKVRDTHGSPAFETAYREAVAAGKAIRVVKAQRIWREYLMTQIETGQPYLLFADAANRTSNQQNLGIIHSSNLCVAPETPILTETGWHPIRDLKDQKVKVWNGEEFAPTTVRQTGANKSLLRVRLNNGAELHCTPYHRFEIQHGKDTSVVRASELKKGMKIPRCEYPVINGSEEAPYAYTHGLFCADGTYMKGNGELRRCGYAARGDGRCKRHTDYPDTYGADGDVTCRAQAGGRKPLLALYGEKIDLLKHLEYRTTGTEIITSTGGRRLTLTLPLDMPDKDAVPLHASVRDKLDWLAGYLDGDGTVHRNGNAQTIQAAATDKKFLHKVMLLLQTLGVQSTVRPAHPARNSSLPDGHGGYKEYACQSTSRLQIATAGVNKLLSLGLHTHRLQFDKTLVPRRVSMSRFVKIEEVEDLGRVDDTYCFNEPKREKGIFNGVLTRQCSEICQYSDDKEYACCTLASIALPKHVDVNYGRHSLIERGPLTLVRCPGQIVCIAEGLLKLHNIPHTVVLADDAKPGQLPGVLYDGNGNAIGGRIVLDDILRPVVNYESLAETTRQVVRNLESVIDRNHYPTPETKLSNMKHRPLGIGVQGLADVYNLLRYPFDSEEAGEVNKKLSATIYYAAMQESIELAKENGLYMTFDGSPLSRGQFQFDLWGISPIKSAGNMDFNWERLRANVQQHGARHSLLTAYMPTASTSQILGNNECFEPRTSNIYRRETSAGSFVVVNKHCVRYLKALGIWNAELKDAIIANRGSLRGVHPIPVPVQKIFNIAWDLSMKSIIDQAADRGAYVCQSQSMNHYYDGRPTIGKLTSAYFYAWKKGLITGVYYCHTRAPVDGLQAVTLAPTVRKSACASCEG